MKFEIHHEFDAPLDTLELALMSPDFATLLTERLEPIESIVAVTHELTKGEFTRVWRFQATAPLKLLRDYQLGRDLMTWDEHSTYRLAAHTGSWHVVPRADDTPAATWRKHFRAAGTYQLDPLSNGRTRRTVTGDVEIHLQVIGPVVERIALVELRKAYDAEADALRALCSLG
ncbi:MAG: DUF2505 family protein [Myxococcales bacterium]|nr:DUF2505 family protein [Myxococcales bacterium]